MIGADFGIEQFLAARLALGVQLAGMRLFFVRNARRHRAAGDHDRRQMAEAQRPHQQAGDDLVADAEQRRALEQDRKSVVSGKSVSVRVDLGGRRIIKKKKTVNKRITKLNLKLYKHNDMQ